MSDIPNRALTPAELKQFKKDQELKKLLDGVEQEFTKRGEIPAKWFGRPWRRFALAGLAVMGSVETYRLQQARNRITEEFEEVYSE